MSAGWRALRLRVPTDREDELVAVLWSAGALGFESSPRADGWVDLVAWTPDPLPEALREFDLRARGAVLLSDDGVPDRDWLEEHRRSSRPFDVGRGFRFDPRDPEEGPPEGARGSESGRHLLRIPARTAFGTGSHETTRLVVEILEDLDLEGRRVLDVGTGSGILAMVALVLGARQAVGFDVDSAALPIARDNARRNRLAPRLFAGRIAGIAVRAGFDVVVVNALPHEVADELEAIVARTIPGGILVLSGVPSDREEETVRAIGALGCRSRERRHDGEWSGLIFEKAVG